ncbi:hypothetical protein E2C01_090292 [Portunus trituberculatus]|uniref:Uncharacterized protein n=1 Tax=Portunus trituberculatus TaxID=210409 RepID=A0A5B7JLF6_PORTR|nr:hypothetical protein [Portunus trituberculatus]
MTLWRLMAVTIRSVVEFRPLTDCVTSPRSSLENGKPATPRPVEVVQHLQVLIPLLLKHNNLPGIRIPHQAFGASHTPKPPKSQQPLLHDVPPCLEEPVEEVVEEASTVEEEEEDEIRLGPATSRPRAPSKRRRRLDNNQGQEEEEEEEETYGSRS